MERIGDGQKVKVPAGEKAARLTSLTTSRRPRCDHDHRPRLPSRHDYDDYRPDDHDYRPHHHDDGPLHDDHDSTDTHHHRLWVVGDRAAQQGRSSLLAGLALLAAGLGLLGFRRRRSRPVR